MNTAMYEHPLTSAQLKTVKGFWKDTSQCVVVPPIVKLLACGDVGIGALAALDTIVTTAKQQLQGLSMSMVDD